MKPKKPSDANYWRLNKLEYSTYAIEWTGNKIEYNGKVMNGAVRAKLDDIANWDYYECKDVRNAERIGEWLIDKQIKRRMKK